MGKKEVGLTTDNLQEFKDIQHRGVQEEKMHNAQVGQGEIGGKTVNWNYNEGKAE